MRRKRTIRHTSGIEKTTHAKKSFHSQHKPFEKQNAFTALFILGLVAVVLGIIFTSAVIHFAVWILGFFVYVVVMFFLLK